MCDYKFKRGAKKGTVCGVKSRDGKKKCCKHRKEKKERKREEKEMEKVMKKEEICGRSGVEYRREVEVGKGDGNKIGKGKSGGERRSEGKYKVEELVDEERRDGSNMGRKGWKRDKYDSEGDEVCETDRRGLVRGQRMCDYEFKKGIRKGQVCGVKSRDGLEKCGRHREKKKEGKEEMGKLPMEIKMMVMSFVKWKDVRGSVEEKLRFEKETGLRMTRGKVEETEKVKRCVKEKGMVYRLYKDDEETVLEILGWN
ncbi:hypothetical protein DFJ73DRAFT_757163 [Zopfochytrium polystomum]|nr:hypothetical protein DFJ73DRAFT_757163 [Zopfochytrium polystomum]